MQHETRQEFCISTIDSSSLATRLATPFTSRTAKSSSRPSKAKQLSVRKRRLRFGVLAANAAVLVLVASLVVQNSHGNDVTTHAALSTATASAETAKPLDQVSSADIALTVARMSSLPESTAISNQAQSQAVSMNAPVTSIGVATKPQVVSTSLKSKADIQTYTVASGDSVASLSQKFGVTSDSIRWSNGLSGDALTAGTKLVIPPVNGIVYTVKPGDTVDSLAAKYNASRDKIIAFNDAELNGLQPGTRIVVPDGTQAVSLTAAQIARNAASSRAASFPWGGSPIYGYNGYDYGYCTWYVANKIAVPSNWGNANTWDNLAAASGWTVSTAPRAGAIAQSDAGYFGHVAYVEAVSDDGTQIKYSDMNGLAGWGRVGYSGWTPSSHFMHYIYR